MSTHRFGAAAAEADMLRIRADIRQVLPAAGALLIRGLLDRSAQFGTASDVEFAQDEELMQRGGVVPDGVGETLGWQGEAHGGFE